MTEKHREQFVEWLESLAALVKHGQLEPSEAVAIQVGTTEEDDSLMVFAFSAFIEPHDEGFNLKYPMLERAIHFFSGSVGCTRGVLAERIADDLMTGFKREGGQ